MKKKDLSLLLLLLCVCSWAWADVIPFSESYSIESTTDGWTTSVSGRFDPVILEEEGNYFMSVSQNLRSNNGCVVTSTILADKVAAGTDFVLSFDMRLGNSGGGQYAESPVSFTINDAENKNVILSLVAKDVSTNISNSPAWILNDTETEVELPNSGVSTSISQITWCSYIIYRYQGLTFIKITNKDTGESILDQTLIDASNTGGLGNMVFTTKRFRSNLAIDNISLRDLQDDDLSGITPTTYTVCYRDENNTKIKEDEVCYSYIGAMASASQKQKKSVMYNERKYIFKSEGDPIILTDNTISNVIMLVYRTANEYNYTVNATDEEGNILKVLEASKRFEDDEFEFAYPAYIECEGKLWSRYVRYRRYSEKFRLTQNNQVFTLPYNATGIDNVIYCSEAEDIDGMTRSSQGNSAVVSSSLAMAYAERDIILTTLLPGEYNLTSVLYAPNSSGGSMTFVIGDYEFTHTAASTNYNQKTFESFVLTKRTDVILKKGGKSNLGIDLLYITGESVTDVYNTSTTISLPAGTNTADYKQMVIEMTNIDNGQKINCVVTDKTTYTFTNILNNTVWNIVLRNGRGEVFGRIDNVDIGESGTSVTFDQLAIPRTVQISVTTDSSTNESSTDLTDKVKVTWTDEEGNYISQDTSLCGLTAGTVLNYSIVLSEEPAMQYQIPDTASYTVKDGDNNIVVKLQPLRQMTMKGKVHDGLTGMTLSNVAVSACQSFNGKYTKTTVAKTDNNGYYALNLLAVPTKLTLSMNDYVSQAINITDSLMTDSISYNVPDVGLMPVSGASITVNFTYTSTVEDGNGADTQSWYSDHANVNYSVYNETKNAEITNISVQYPQIVLLEDVEEGDVLRLTATSRTGAFKEVVTTATIADQKAEVIFDIIELGRIEASYAQTGNASVVGSLYDASGKLVKTYNYSDSKLTISGLADGEYTLVSMGSSQLYNTIYDLAQLPETGLAENIDYVQNTVEVESGKVSAIENKVIPTFNESKLYYTGDKTSFISNKTNVVVGNYITLTGHIDFKEAYSESVSNVQMIVDLPESCGFMEKSVMTGSAIGSYTYNDHRLIIPMPNYSDRVRFCIIPTANGEYSPSAFVQFELNGETITQPIGSANYTSKSLSISVPSTISKKIVPVSGTAVGKSTVEIYDNDVLIGQTTSLPNGSWATTCTLDNPYNLSQHQIYAKVTTQQGYEILSETSTCIYDKNSIQVSKVKMYYDNPELHKTFELTFDFLNPTTKEENYSYYMANKKFTFTIDFTENDTAKVSDVVLYVKTAKSGWHPLDATYDAKQNLWVAAGEFGNMNDGDLPVNVGVNFDTPKIITPDFSESFDAEVNLIDSITQNAIIIGENLQVELLEDYDSLTVFRVPIPETNLSGIYKIQILDYQNAEQLLSMKQFDFEETEHGYRYVLSKSNENGEALMLIDSGEKIAYLFYYADNDYFDAYNFLLSESASAKGRAWMKDLTSANVGSLTKDFLKKSANIKYLKEIFTQGNWIGLGTILKDGLSDLFGLNKYLLKPNLNQYFDIMALYMTEMETKGDILVKALSKKCSDGNYRLSDSDINKYAQQIQGYNNNIDLIYNTFVSYTELYKSKLKCSAAIDIFMALGTAGLSELGSLAAKGITNSGRILTNSKNAKYFKRWITNPTMRGYLENALGVGFGALIGKISDVVNPEEADFEGVEDEMNKWMSDSRNEMEKLYRIIRSNIENGYKKCDTDSEPVPDPIPNPNPGPDQRFGIDPSGFVYEGVTANRLEGVTATIYYKEEVEDMYGDLHENIVKWDAEEYAQENPLFTDENGYYRWDVPQGLWQVKFEKEGYETTYSEWLPVPPPQLDVNIAMKQNVQPTVKDARAYEDAVEVEFDKYMMPELLTTDNIRVMHNGEFIAGEIELLNEEASYEGSNETFASKIRFNAAEPFTEQEVTLMVSNRVKSYAGTKMQDDYQQTFTIEQEIKEIQSDSAKTVGYGDKATLIVNVLPASASKGKTLTVKTSSPMILGVETEQVSIGNDGKAEVMLSGELPGTAALTFSVEGTDKTALTIANVEQKVNADVAAPTANIASGTVVEKGTAIILSCTTEGATIYYTTDGTCPCDETGSRKVYDGTPIVIENSVTLKAMAVAPDLTESDVAEFVYTVQPEDEQGDVNGDGKVNGTDLVLLTNLIMSDLYGSSADMNNDGKVNGTDYVLMVNVIMNMGQNAKAKSSKQLTLPASLTIEDFDIKAGETKEMLIDLRNINTDVTLVQFDLRLPAGLSIATENGTNIVDIAGRTTWKKHTLLNNNLKSKTRFLLCSSTNALITGNDGAIIKIGLTAADNFDGGTITLENQLIVTPAAEETVPATYRYVIGGTSSVDASVLNQGSSASDVFTLNGSKVRTKSAEAKGLPKGIYIINGQKITIK